MEAKKKKVAVIFGGRSPEHEISLKSAVNIIAALDKEKYDVLPIGITKDGKWIADADALNLLNRGGKGDYKEAQEVVWCLNPAAPYLRKIGAPESAKIIPDVVLPVLHGPFGEDGTVQGLLELSGLPYAGCGVLGSALGMDKVIQKEVFKAAGLPVTPWLTVGKNNIKTEKDSIFLRAEEMGYPLFVKPANMGSSVGVHKAYNRQELEDDLEDALRYDTKALIEKAVPMAREIECAILGNRSPKASVLGEIRPSGEFYDYNAKYVDEKSSAMIPADLPDELAGKIRKMTVIAFCSLDCFGLARADFLLDGNTSEIFINEINTFPGFTSISMFPKLWEAGGLSCRALLDEIINLALERHKEKAQLRSAYL